MGNHLRKTFNMLYMYVADSQMSRLQYFIYTKIPFTVFCYTCSHYLRVASSHINLESFGNIF